MLAVQLPHRGSGGPLHLLIPSRDIASQCPAGHWMNCMKLLGQTLMARDFDPQTAELQNRIAILNRFTALGTPATQPVV